MPNPLQRLARLAPYLKDAKAGLVGAVVGSAVGAATEPAIPELMRPLLDKGFSGRALPLWMIPVAIIGLFLLRGVAGFVANYGLAWTANRAVLRMRDAMFGRLLAAAPALFTSQSASSLTNSPFMRRQA